MINNNIIEGTKQDNKKYDNLRGIWTVHPTVWEADKG